jgi:hypothetical protein
MIERQFEKMGAGLRLINTPRPDRANGVRQAFGRMVRSRPLSVNVVRGEFIISKDSDVKVRVVDIDPKGRHLLLMSEIDGTKEKYLCGHDERDWFVAAVPGRPSNIVQAMEALKPAAAREAQNRKGVRKKNRNKRKNKGFIRQGEWFFLPAPDLKPDKIRIVGPEPITRDRNSKPHMVQFCYRRALVRRRTPSSSRRSTRTRVITPLRILGVGVRWFGMPLSMRRALFVMLITPLFILMGGMKC